MNVIKFLEKRIDKNDKDKIVHYIGDDQLRFAQLAKAFLDGPDNISQQAAWPLSYCVNLHPELIKPYLKKVIQNLKKPGIPDAIKRNTVRLLQFIDIPKSLQGKVWNICFSFLKNTDEPIAVRVFSMTVLGNLSREYPELKKELSMLLKDRMPYEGAAFLARGKKLIRKLDS